MLWTVESQAFTDKARQSTMQRDPALRPWARRMVRVLQEMRAPQPCPYTEQALGPRWSPNSLGDFVLS